MFSSRWWLVAVVVYGSVLPSARAQKEFGFVNTKPSGQPYLSPEESLKRLHVPPGWEVKVFAAEPDIINPISFTVDERGRLWVVECYEYPKRTPKGKKPRDRIKILEDTTGAGKADRVTVWAEGKDLPTFDLASGIEAGHGGVFLGAAPYLFFLRDSTGAGHCDQCEILLKGFGSQDTHETLNTLQWGPDGRLHGLHGIFTQSKVGDVQMNAAVWRYDVGSKKFDIFAEGTSNPWGLDFDAHGQAFLTACVIPHCFHMVPDGTYIRQAGSSFNPYAYGLLREISDHQHHQESGWAHAGALVLQGDQIPPEYQGSLLMGSIHGCSIKRDILGRRGSTFVARHGPDFLVSGDKNFRPINLRWGPDGSIYVIDWHDQNPCHQAAPDSWDMTHGRVYKIQRTGTKGTPPGDLSRKSSQELVDLLKNNNPWWHRTALRLLGERRDRSVAPLLEEMVLRSKNDAHSLRGLWGLFAVGAFDEKFAAQTLSHESPWVRSWTIRLLGEAGRVSDAMLQRLARRARDDQAPEVRLQLASTVRRLTTQDALPLLHNLMQHKEDVQDPCIPLMIWLAYEPRLAGHPHSALAWLQDHAAGNPLITDEIVPRTMRRLVATNRAEDLAACVAFLGEAKDSTVRRRALEGLTLAMQNRQAEMPSPWKRVYATLLQDSDREVQRLARRLAVNFHDLEALRRSLAIARDSQKPLTERIDAVRDVAVAHPPEALKTLTDLLAHDTNTDLRCEVCRALSAYNSPEIARIVLTGWKRYPPAVRVEAVNLLAGRKEWARELLAAVGRKDVPRTDLNDNTILRILALRDKQLNGQIEAVWGRVRDQTPAELNALIDRMRGALFAGRGSLERGRKVFENQCAKCHKFEGRGHDVGPNLDGAARDIEYLLVNVLDPNRVVGQPYYTRFVELKNGRIETGLLAAEDEQSITLKTENDALKVIQRKDIQGITVQDKSLMPEGLNNTMTPQDFRDLIRYVMASPFLTEVAVGGPYPPKEAISLDPENPLSEMTKSWDRPVVGPPGKIPLPGAKDGEEVISYVAAEVTAPSAMRSRLQLGAGSTVKVWLNGKVVYNDQPGQGPATPDQAGVDVSLRAGVNHLLFKVTYRGKGESLYARLLDPQRKLKYPEPKN
jgi:putative membrane-bound dehydrogenase-like protein